MFKLNKRNINPSNKPIVVKQNINQESSTVNPSTESSSVTKSDSDVKPTRSRINPRVTSVQRPIRRTVRSRSRIRITNPVVSGSETNVSPNANISSDANVNSIPKISTRSSFRSVAEAKPPVSRNSLNNRSHLIDDKKQKGNMLWLELHNRAINHDGSNDAKFINEFGKKIPRFMHGCSCNEFWNKWIRANPPNYAQGKYFEWTVKTHNAVNAKLGKPQITLEEAYAMWGNHDEAQD